MSGRRNPHLPDRTPAQNPITVIIITIIIIIIIVIVIVIIFIISTPGRTP